MVRYETLILVRSESTAEDRAFLEKSISNLIAQFNGVVSTFDQWGKLRLAYPVAKENYGLYILVRYELPVEAVAQFTKDLQMFFRIKASEFVFRFVNVRLEADAPTTYLRPEPVDSAKALAEAGSFVRGEGRDRDRGDRGDRPDRGDRGGDRGDRGPRGERTGRFDRTDRPFQVMTGPGKRFSHDHSSEDDVMTMISDDMAA